MSLLSTRPLPCLASLFGLPAVLAGMVTASSLALDARAQTLEEGGAITLRSDVQEANSITGVITARGNVQIEYPAQQIYATSAQAQYFSQEQRIVLSGDVHVLQEGNSLKAETVTYLIVEGRFVALPQPDEQVESIYVLPENQATAPDALAPSPASSPPAELNLSPVAPPEGTEGSGLEDSETPAVEERQDPP